MIVLLSYTQHLTNSIQLAEPEIEAMKKKPNLKQQNHSIYKHSIWLNFPREFTSQQQIK